MNKKTATWNPADVYAAFIQTLLLENQEYWGEYSRAHKRHNYRIFVHRKNNSEVKEVISMARWMKIVKLYFLLARKKVIGGGRVQLGHRLGAVQARTISRNFKNKQIDWQATRQQPWVTDPVSGKKKRAKIIYHNSETYSRIAWEKLRSIPNEKMYKFVPAKGNGSGKGFKGEFALSLKEDPLLHTRYKQFTDELSIS